MKQQARSQRRKAEELAPTSLEFLSQPNGQAGLSDPLQSHNQPSDGRPQPEETARYGHQFGSASLFSQAPTAAQTQTRSADAPILRKPAEESSGARGEFGTVTMRGPIQRDGQDLPGGAQIETVNKDTGAVTSAIRRIAAVRAADNADFESRVGPLLGPAANTLTTVNFDFVETSGLNVQWTGSVRFRIGTPKPVGGGGAADTKRSGGTSVSTSNQTTTSSKDSAGATAGGSTGSQSGPETSRSTSGTSGSATVGTENSRSDQNTNTATTSTGAEASMRNQYQRYEASLIAEISVLGRPDFSGSDYINPFKWGFAAVGEIMSERRSGSVQCGSVNYYISQGMAPPGPPAAGGAVQRQSRMEQALGITDEAKSNFAQSVAAQSIDPAVQFSRSGNTPLPEPVASMAEQHHGTSMSNVRLIHGGQADTYCDTMSAAAFTTPNTDGGSDVFMHSGVSLDSMKGQHTLQHEIAHAVQQSRGETAGLDGLGGDPSRRSALENGADKQANAVLGKSGALLKREEEV